MSYQSPITGSIISQSNLLAGTADLFLFDLKNEAMEHGFKTDEPWTLQLCSDNEISDLKKKYSPVISTRLHPDTLLSVFLLVKEKLQQPLHSSDLAITENNIARDEKKHLAAYSSKRSH